MTRIGVFADPHYARGKIYGRRYCALSLIKLEKVVAVLNAQKVDFAVCLGDLIDSQLDEDEDIENILAVSKCLYKLNAPLHIVLGNHDLEAMSKQRFLRAVGTQRQNAYYSFEYNGTLFVVLDACNTAQGAYTSGNYEWTDARIDEAQIAWLRKTIGECRCGNVVVFVHQNLDMRAADGKTDAHMVSNADEIRGILQRARGNVTVVQGHYHDGFDQTIEGVRYLTLRAVCEGDDITKVPYCVVDIDGKAQISLPQ